MGSSITPSPEGQPDLVVGVLYQFEAAAAQDSAVRHAVQRAGDVAEHASDAGDKAQLHTREKPPGTAGGGRAWKTPRPLQCDRVDLAERSWTVL